MALISIHTPNSKVRVSFGERESHHELRIDLSGASLDGQCQYQAHRLVAYRTPALSDSLHPLKRPLHLRPPAFSLDLQTVHADPLDHSVRSACGYDRLYSPDRTNSSARRTGAVLVVSQSKRAKLFEFASTSGPANHPPFA